MNLASAQGAVKREKRLPFPYNLPLSYRVRRRLQRAVCSRMLLDLGPDHTSTVFVAGSGRSGTTWLADIINYRNDYRYMFEPFHPDGPVGSIFPRHLYLRPGERQPDRLAAARRVLVGQIHHPFVDRFNQRLIARRRVIKDITANLLLRWLRVYFPGMPIILIIRHPCAVASSRVKLRWETTLSCMLDQPELVTDFLQPFMSELKAITDPFEQHIAMWCIQHYVPLQQSGLDGIHVVFYENLCLEPERELADLMSFLGRGYDERILKAVEVASLLAVPHSAIFNGRELVGAWSRDVSSDQLRRAREIMGMFGLDRVYSDGPMPDTKALMQLRVRHSDPAPVLP